MNVFPETIRRIVIPLRKAWPLARAVGLPAVAAPQALQAGLAALLFTGAVARSLAEDWPTYKHDARRSGVTEESLSFPLQPAWTYRSAQPPAPAWPEPEKNVNRLDFDYAFAPVVAGNLLVFGSSADDTVRALDTASGALQWQFTAGGPIRFAPQIEKGKVYFGADDGWAYCLAAANGKLLWRFHGAPADERLIGNRRMMSRWPVRTGMLVESNIAYFAAGMWDSEGVFLYALDADSGKAIWCNDTSGSGLPRISHDYFSIAGINPQGAILAGGNILLVPNGRCIPAFFDRQTGRLLYYQPGGGGDMGLNTFGSAWVIIDGERCYMSGVSGVAVMSLRTFDRVTAVRAFYPSEGQYRVLVRNGKMTIRGAYGLIQASDKFVLGGDGEVWAEPVTASAGDKRAAGKNSSTDALWRGKVNGRAYDLAVAQGRLYVSTDCGEITCFAPGPGHAVAPAFVPTASRHQESRDIGTTAGKSAGQEPGRAAVALEPLSAGEKAVLAALREAGCDHGFALLLGDPTGRLAKILASATALQIVSALPEHDSSILRQELLRSTSWYGSRIHVATVTNFQALPFAQFFAQAVIVAGTVPGLNPRELYRLTRPLGGVLLAPGIEPSAAQQFLRQSGAPAGEIATAATPPRLIRGALEGAWDFDSKLPGDSRVRWPLRLLWFGEPGPAKLYDRKAFANFWTGANGLFFVVGDHTLTAVDAYNGWEWWSRPLWLAPRGHGLGLKANAQSLYLSIPPSRFSTTNRVVVQLDARTGRQQKIYGEFAQPPVVSLTTPQSWPLLTSSAQQLGSLMAAADQKGLTLTLTAPAPETKHQCDWSFGLDLRPLETRFGLFESNTWQYFVFPADDSSAPAAWKPGTGIGHPPITVAGTASATGSVTTVRLLWADLSAATGGRPLQSFGFCATLNLRSTNAQKPASPLLPKTQAFLFCNASADGVNAGWANVFPGGSAPAAAKLPAIVAGLDALPTNAPLRTATQQLAVKQRRRVHPLTGDLTDKFIVVGEGCGGNVYSQSTLFTRAGSLAFYDFDDDSGYRFLGAERPPCGGGSMAAFGVWFAADGGSGCECSYAYLTSLAMAPAERRLHEDWAVFSDWPVDTIVRQAALNFGAPGDRRDEHGALWLGFPRPALAKRGATQTGPDWFNIPGVAQQAIPMALPVPLDVEVAEGFGPYRFNADRTPIAGTERPWLYASGYSGVRKAVLRLNILKPMAAASTVLPPTLNGRVDDAAWGDYPQAVTAVQKTRVYLCHDAKQLYVGVFQPVDPEHRMGPKWNTSITKRDAVVSPDNGSHSLEVFLSDARRGVSVCLAVAAGGARYDALSRTNSAYDVRWNADWAAAVAADANGLGFELAIPWQVLESAGLEQSTLGMNVQVNSGYQMGEALLRLGGLGRARCDNYVPLGLNTAPIIPSRLYTVRLHFAEPSANTQPGQRVFDVKIQGQTVLKGFDIVKEAKAPLRALVREIKGIRASDTLTLEFLPAGQTLRPENAPILCGLELAEESESFP